MARWYDEAERNGVLPLSDGVMDRLAHLFLPWPTGAARVELRPGERVFEDNTPTLCNGFTITAHLGAPLATDSVGVLAEQGDYNGGWVWHADGGAAAVRVQLRQRVRHRSCRSLFPVGASVAAGSSAAADGDAHGPRSATPTATSSATGHLPHEWPGLWTPNSSASLLAGVGRPLPVCDGYDPTVAVQRRTRPAGGRGRVRADIRRPGPPGRDRVPEPMTSVICE